MLYLRTVMRFCAQYMFLIVNHGPASSAHNLRLRIRTKLQIELLYIAYIIITIPFGQTV
jgi:hypothetical protein